MSEIYWQLYIIIIFSLPILVNLKDGFQLAIIKDGFFNKGLLADPDFNTSSLTTPRCYSGEKMETMLRFVDEDRLPYTAWVKIQKKVIKAKNTQSFYLKCFFTIIFQPLGSLFFSNYDFELIKTLIIVSEAKLKLSFLYKARLRIECKALELHVEEAKLDVLAIEIMQQKKKTMACQIRSNQNQKKKKKLQRP